MSFIRSTFRKLNYSFFSYQRRHAGGFFQKNMRIEENAGLREGAYRSYELSSKNVISILKGLIIPSIIFYNMVEWELVSFKTRFYPKYYRTITKLTMIFVLFQNIRDRSIGITREYGMFPKIADSQN